MFIFSREQAINAISRKIHNSNNNDLKVIYKTLFNTDITIEEELTENVIEDAVHKETGCHVTANITSDDLVDIIPDNYQALADFWEVGVMSDAFLQKLRGLEDKWNRKLNKIDK